MEDFSEYPRLLLEVAQGMCSTIHLLLRKLATFSLDINTSFSDVHFSEDFKKFFLTNNLDITHPFISSNHFIKSSLLVIYSGPRLRSQPKE